MNVEKMREVIAARAIQANSNELIKTLNTRKIAELEFHNRKRDKNAVASLPQDTFELLHGNKKYYTTVQVSRDYVTNWIATEAKGKIFLDYACGNGENALQAARSGAALAIGLDISDVSVRNASENAAQRGLSNAIFTQGDCENTGLPENSVDVIICSGMLHHLDLSYAFPELRRILKPGGKILAVEALNYNPIIKLYRIMTPTMRTEWEKSHILSLKDLAFADRFFAVENVRYWHITSYFCALIPHAGLKNIFLKLCNGLDALLTRIPFVQLLAWQFTFELRKRNE